MDQLDNTQDWCEVLHFWFPEGHRLDTPLTEHQEHWAWRMRGGADDEIKNQFTELTEEAAAGKLDYWISKPEGRLALIIVLDQFSRSVWRNDARAFAQDSTALALTLEGLDNGHYATLTTPWCQVVYGLPLGHCEGPDHLSRLRLLIKLREEIARKAPVHLQPIYQLLVKQARDVQNVISAFGRHPHRNQILGRPSTPAEQSYIAQQQFPHLRAFGPSFF